MQKNIPKINNLIANLSAHQKEIILVVAREK
jgi:hypothetical protein